MTSGSFPIGASVTIEDLSADPHPVLGRLREHEPVSWIPDLDGWLVTRRDLCIAVMRDSDTFTVNNPRFSTQQVIGPSMLSLDGADHRRHREPFVDPFRSEAIRALLAEWTYQRANDLVREIAPLGGADLRAALAAPLSVHVMKRVLDLQGIGISELLEWYEAIVAAVHAVTAGGEVSPAGRMAYESLHGAVASNMTTSSLLEGIGDSLSTGETVSNVAVLLFGGIVTAESTTAMVLQYLLRDRRAYESVKADRSLVGNAVEEAMRLEPAAAAVDRYATRPAQLGGASIAPGDLVRVSLTAANRDPETFARPDQYEIHRRNAQQHLAFARGPHACLGIHVARLEAKAALEAALDRLDGLSLDLDRLDEPDGLVFRAPATVEVIWETS